MPKSIKKRVTKKIVIKEEKVKGTATRTIDFIRERKKIFILVSSVLGVVIAVSVAFILYTTALTKKAYSLEREAHNYYYGINLKNPLPEERWKKAMELYNQSLKIKSTPIVQFYIGNCYYKLNDYNNAIKSYTVFIDKYPKEKGILPLVYQKLSSSYIKIGKNDDALKTLEILKKFKNGAFKDSALIEEARLYEAIGRPMDAQKRYNELIKEFPNSSWSVEARSRIEKTKE